MGPGEIVFLIPITAIVLGIGSGIIRSILGSQERRLEMRLKAQQGQNDEVMGQISALRAEVAALRDTSTQFDMSLDDTLKRLAERLERVEAKAPNRGLPPMSQDMVQQIGKQ